MSSPERFGRPAAEAERLAAKAGTPSERATLMKFASEWRRLEADAAAQLRNRPPRRA